MDYFFLIGSLNLSGAEINLIKISNLLAENENDVYIFYIRGDIPKYKFHKNVKILSFENFKDNLTLLRNKVFTVYSYPLAYKLLYRSIIFNLKLKILIRHATYLKPFFEFIPKEYNFFERFMGFFYYNLSISFLFAFKYHMVLNDEMEIELRKRIFFKKKRIFVLHNLVEDKLLGISPNKTLKYDIAFVGRITKEKGIFDFLDLLKRLNYEYRSLIIGKIPDYNKYLLTQFDSKKNIFYKPFDLNYISKYLTKTKLLVFPSYREGSPNVVLESLAIGLPVVAYKCKTGLKNLINKDNGYLVPLGNIKILRQRVEMALKKSWEIDLIKKSVKNHTPYKVYSKFIKIIDLIKK